MFPRFASENSPGSTLFALLRACVRAGRGWVGMVVLAVGATGQAANRDQQMTFVGVTLDTATQKADERLRDFFRGRLALNFEPREKEYGAAIDTLVHWQTETQGPLMARVTPYVYLVAEMLGADLEILGTYVSKRTQETTYHSYFVVRRDAGLATDDLDALVKHLRHRPTPARFVYHNKFSTSSYLLPSLFFRKMGIFSGAGTNGQDQRQIFIRAENPPGITGSSELVQMVKRHEADIAAVWEGSQSSFVNDPELLFIKLPNTLPNDLLVMTPLADRTLRDAVLTSLRGMKDTDIGVGDFLRWQDFNAAPEARRALAALRWLAAVSPSPVPIKIGQERGAGAEVDPALLEAAKQAVRLSGTEFILFDEDFHKQADVLWTIRKSHDDSLVIRSQFVDFAVPAQEFHLSFKRGDTESLVARIEDQISNGMHRVRDVWAFDDETPTVLRDVRFNLPPGTKAKAVKVTWNDLTNNDRVVGAPFEVTVEGSDFRSFKFRGDGFPKRSDGKHYDFDPLSNTAHRVVLVRPVNETRLFRIGTYALVGLFSLAAVCALGVLFRGAEKPEAGKAE